MEASHLQGSWLDGFIRKGFTWVVIETETWCPKSLIDSYHRRSHPAGHPCSNRGDSTNEAGDGKGPLGSLVDRTFFLTLEREIASFFFD